MKQLLRNEIKKSMRTKGFFIALCVGMSIGLFQMAWFYKNVYLPNNEEYAKVINAGYEDTLYGTWFETGILQAWMGSEIYSPCNQLFYLLFPLLAALPYGGSLYQEWGDGYAAQMISRCSRKKYFLAKAAGAFISGGTVVFVPLFLNFILTACYVPVIGTDPLSMQAVISNKDMWASLFFEEPALYAMAYMAVDFMYGGFFACISLAVTHCFDNIFSVIAFPMLFACCLYYGMDSLLPSFRSYNISDIINPAQLAGMNRCSAMALATAATVLILTLVYCVANHKRDMLKQR